MPRKSVEEGGVEKRVTLRWASTATSCVDGLEIQQTFALNQSVMVIKAPHLSPNTHCSVHLIYSYALTDEQLIITIMHVQPCVWTFRTSLDWRETFYWLWQHLHTKTSLVCINHLHLGGRFLHILPLLQQSVFWNYGRCACIFTCASPNTKDAEVVFTET